MTKTDPVVAIFPASIRTEVFTEPDQEDEFGTLVASCMDLIEPSLSMLDGQKAKAILLVWHQRPDGTSRQVIGSTETDPNIIVERIGHTLRVAIGREAFEALMRAFIENDD